MTLPPAAATRRLKHRRTIDVQVFARGNGKWEVDATVSDVKTRDTLLGNAVREAGAPIHDMLLRLVIDERMNILEAGSETRAMPYNGVCGAHGDAYAQLVGLNLLQDFRGALRQRVGGMRACTHLTELAQVLPTAVVQAFAGDVIDTRGNTDGAVKPFQIDRCHALRSDSATVQQHYPRWYRPRPAAPAAPPFMERASEEER